MADIFGLELSLRKQLRGKTLLGEVAFTEEQCHQAANVFRKAIVGHGLSAALRGARETCPALYALWLVNEAFYGYDGSFWPPVLKKVGLQNSVLSSQLGQTFLDILDDLKLPRFRRLNTRWSYLGPILAHCGIPRFVLPEFFGEVLPVAARVGVASADGLADLEARLPQTGVSRPVEWFIRFGDSVAADFLRRCLDLYRVARAGGDVPPADAFGLPRRVWDEFNTWRTKSPLGSHEADVSLLRPRLFLDPSRGVRLELPSQPCPPAYAFLDWEVRVDAESLVLRQAPRFAGESRTQSEELLLPTPFGSVAVRLKQPEGREIGTWILGGLPTDRPVLCFEPMTMRLLSVEALEPGAVGVAIPTGHRVDVFVGAQHKTAPVLSRLGRLPFGWSAFEAAVYDCTGSIEIALVDEQGRPSKPIELREQRAPVPRLDGPTLREIVTPDRARVYVGEAPTLRIPASLEDLRSSWAVAVQPVGEFCEGVAPPRVQVGGAALFSESHEPGWLSVPLGQPQLLGADPWGAYDVVATGPLGQTGRFRVVVVPPLRVEHDWAEWKQGASVRTRVKARAEVVSRTARFDEMAPDVLLVESERTPLRLRCSGYAARMWSLPVDLYLPMPSWAVHDEHAAAHLATWTSRQATVSLPETDGRAPILLVRTATPWGVPSATSATLRHGDTVLVTAPVRLDGAGNGQLDLAPFIANARQAGYSRVQLQLDLQLARAIRLQCLSIERNWTSESLTAVDDGEDRVSVTWSERFPAHGRVLRVYSRLSPWEPHRTIRLEATARGRWNGPRETLASDFGRYRVEIGVEDEWTGVYESVDNCEWDYGTSEQWRGVALFTSPSIDGFLYRCLLAVSEGRPIDTADPLRDVEGRAEERADKVLRARQVLAAESTAVRRRMDRLLAGVPLWAFLRGALRAEVCREARTVLELGILSTARHIGDAGPLTPEQADDLWRSWAPLGAWADARAMLEGDQGVPWSRLHRHLGSEALQSVEASVRQAPELQLVDLVKSGQAGILRQVEAHAKPYPTSPIGEEAFQAACFEWAIGAAEQQGRRAALSQLCRELRQHSGEVSRREDGLAQNAEVYGRLRAELSSRGHRFAADEPLYAVHQTTWLVASLMVWRSLGRPSFFLARDDDVVQWAISLHAVAPALLAHDLIKVCAIESLFASRTHDASGPLETHD
jgi:hypothetical protein